MLIYTLRDPLIKYIGQIRFNPNLTELIPTSHLDAEFGGDYNFRYDYPTYWKTITEFCHLVNQSFLAR